jgi:hypothetical protein
MSMNYLDLQVLEVLHAHMKRVPPPPPRYPPGVPKGPLRSRFFSIPSFAPFKTRLQAAADHHPMHIMRGSRGGHVSIIYNAMDILQPFVKSIPCPAPIGNTELKLGVYGGLTETKVLLYKQKMTIINRDYQSKADNICGIMTMRMIDYNMQQIDQYCPTWLDDYYSQNS